MKKCLSCGEIKELDCFGKCKASKDGLKTRCKHCLNKERKEYYNRNKEKSAKYSKNYYEKNKEAISAWRKKWVEDNRDVLLDKAKKYRRVRYNSDELFKMKSDIRTRIRSCFKSYGGKEKSSIEYLGCSIESYKEYLESKFAEGMTWDNYGEWHIDHVIPLASAKTKTELGALFHYKNTQPLWAEDNLRKRDKII